MKNFGRKLTENEILNGIKKNKLEDFFYETTLGNIILAFIIIVGGYVSIFGVYILVGGK